MAAVVTKRDPNLDHPAVRMYREICRLTANWIQRRDIVATIKMAVDELGFTSDRALLLWKTTCEDHMRTGKNPRNVAWIMDQYEERLRGPKWDRHNRKTG